MCANCVSSFDVVSSQLLAAAVLLKRPVHNRLAAAGIVAPIDELGDLAHTVAFLRSLDLDAEAILGAEHVAAAATWTPRSDAQPQVRGIGRLRSLLPMRSHSLLNVQ